MHDEFLSPTQVSALAACVRRRRERGDFVPARVGAGADSKRRAQIRGDFICWLTEPEFEAEAEVLGLLEELRLRLNRELFLGLFELELHYAWYPPGSGYARHVDRPHRRDQRRLTLVLYLNEQWERSHGGELRVFEGDGRSRDIEPRGGRLVTFLSEGREHEVMPAGRARLSLSGWLRSRAQHPAR